MKKWTLALMTAFFLVGALAHAANVPREACPLMRKNNQTLLPDDTAVTLAGQTPATSPVNAVTGRR